MLSLCEMTWNCHWSTSLMSVCQIIGCFAGLCHAYVRLCRVHTPVFCASLFGASVIAAMQSRVIVRAFIDDLAQLYNSMVTDIPDYKIQVRDVSAMYIGPVVRSGLLCSKALHQPNVVTTTTYSEEMQHLLGCRK